MKHAFMIVLLKPVKSSLTHLHIIITSSGLHPHQQITAEATSVCNHASKEAGTGGMQTRI